MKTRGRVGVAAAVAWSLGASGACAPPPAMTAPSQIPAAASQVPVTHPVEPTAREAAWMPVGGTTTRGVLLPEGRLVLLGGRRALVHPDGSVENERAPAPEPLGLVLLVATAAGDRLVACGLQTIYRLDDGPLGAATAIAATAEPIAMLGTGPGVLAVWTGSRARPRLVDVETGMERPTPAEWPKMAIRQLAFRSMTEGAAVFWAVGRAATADAGKTFRVMTETAPKNAPGVSWVVRSGGQLRVWHGVEGYTTVDPATAVAAGYTIDPIERAPTLRWIQKTNSDPLSAAIQAGVLVDGGGAAVVEGGGLLARVDLVKGTVTDVIDLGKPGCVVGESAGEGLLACSDEPLQSFALVGPLRLRPRDVRVPAFRRAARGYGGGLVLDEACTKDAAEGSRCALQPDGTFQSVPLPSEQMQLAQVGFDELSALPDGRIAFLDGPRSPYAHAQGRIVLADKRGQILELPALKPTEDARSAEVLGDIELGPDGALHAILSIRTEEGTKLDAVRQPLDGSSPTFVEIEGEEALLQNGHAIAYGGSGIRASADFGATWTPLRVAPDGFLSSQFPFGVKGMRYWHTGYRSSDLAVGEAGILVGDWARVGWGKEGARPFPDGPKGSPSVIASPAIHPWSLSCTTQTTGAGAPTLDATGRRKWLDKEASRVVRKGHTQTERFAPSEDGPVATLEAYAPDEHAESPSEWTFRWMDPLEPGEPVHTWRGKPMAGATFYPSLGAVVAERGRVTFAVHEPGHDEIVDVAASGVARRTAADDGVLVSTIRVGTAPGSPVAWLSEKLGVVVWEAGEAPREVATFGDGAGPRAGFSFEVGLPTRDAVPLLLLEDGRVTMRMISLHEASAPLPLDGWTSFGVDESLKACGKGVTGELPVPGSSMDVQVDGTPYKTTNVLLTVHAAANTAPCIAGLRARLYSAPGGAKDKKGSLVSLQLPQVSAGTAAEAGATPRVSSVRCSF